MTFVRRQLLGHAEGLSRRQDRHFGDGVSVHRVQGDEGVAGFMNGDGSLPPRQRPRSMPHADRAGSGRVPHRGRLRR